MCSTITVLTRAKYLKEMNFELIFGLPYQHYLLKVPSEIMKLLYPWVYYLISLMVRNITLLISSILQPKYPFIHSLFDLLEMSFSSDLILFIYIYIFLSRTEIMEIKFCNLHVKANNSFLFSPFSIAKPR